MDVVASLYAGSTVDLNQTDYYAQLLFNYSIAR